MVSRCNNIKFTTKGNAVTCGTVATLQGSIRKIGDQKEALEHTKT